MHVCRKENKKRLVWVLALTSSYFLAEVIGGVLSGSLALLADAAHMAIDMAAIGLGLFAIWISQKPPNKSKTFGYYRAEILAALANGAALIAVSLGIGVEALRRLKDPTPVQGELMTWVAAGGLVVNLIALWVTHQDRDSTLNMRGVWLHIVSDTLGSLSAIVGGVFVWAYGWYLADPIISLMIATLILYNSWNLLSESVNVLLEGVPKEINFGEIRSGLEGLEMVQEVHDLHIWCVTSGVPALSVHVKIEEGVDPGEVLSAIDDLLSNRFKIQHSTIQVEPPGYSHPTLHF